MNLQETFRKFDKPGKPVDMDVRKEAENMVKRHERQLKALKESTPDSAAFRKAAMKSTEAFKADLQEFLNANGAEELYEDLVGFVSGKVSEITRSGSESNA